MQDFWPSSGFSQLQRNARGWLVPTDGYLRLFLARPELALLPESCPAEIALHEALMESPHQVIATSAKASATAAPGAMPVTLAAVTDADVRANYVHYLNFRDGLLAASTLENYYLKTIRSGNVTVPPLFIDLVAQACLRNVLDDATDAFEVRAGEMLFRAQRVTTQDGQILSGDLAVLDLLNETGGLGDMGRLLAQNNAPMRAVNMAVLTDANAQAYWASGERHTFLLDLTHEVTNELGHGLTFTVTRARSGLTALARVLEKWIAHFLGVQVRITPLQKIEDANWRWHVGLDVESTALLNDLYEDHPVESVRMQRLLSLFRLEFANPLEMRADVAGKPVYLALSMNPEKVVKLKPQNLLLNLPIRASM